MAPPSGHLDARDFARTDAQSSHGKESHMRPNDTKRLLGAGRSALGTFCLGGSPLIAETLGRAGYDFVIVDLQHSASTSCSLLGMLQAISCTAATPIVRVSANQPADIQRALDLGAYGLVVPMVNSRAEAEAILQSVRYAPTGSRSWGPLRGWLYGGPDYFANAHEELLIVAMLESAEAARNAEAILSVPGIDACFIGPNDLGIALGFPPELPEYPRPVEEAILAIRDAAAATGKAAGIYTPSAAAARARLAQGFRFVCIQNDFGMVIAAAVEALGTVRA
jgi:4-hydroxy-2-oxoheptanedioate aldolase